MNFVSYAKLFMCVHAYAAAASAADRGHIGHGPWFLGKLNSAFKRVSVFLLVCVCAYGILLRKFANGCL